MDEEQTNIEVQSEPTQPEPTQNVELLEDGTELDNEHGTEVVVHDMDDKGNVIGWHKELQKADK